MNVVICTNGHFFDSDSYSTCPHCGAEMSSKSASAENVTSKQNSKGRRGGLFGKKSKEQKIEIQTNDSHEISTIQTDGSSSTVELQDESSTNPSEALKNKKNNNPTLDFWQVSSATSNEDKTDKSNGTEPICDDSENDDVESLVDPSKETENERSQKSVQQESLKAMVQNASASSKGKTMSYFSAATGNASDGDISVEPVVGWLVCIKGKHFGECFNISAGMNSIGRNESNCIVLKKDNGVSREKHALVTYEPKKRNFYIKPGDSSGLTYVNDDYITETKQLYSRDVIEMGNSRFIFIPLCDQSFTWEDYITRE